MAVYFILQAWENLFMWSAAVLSIVRPLDLASTTRLWIVQILSIKKYDLSSIWSAAFFNHPSHIMYQHDIRYILFCKLLALSLTY